MYKKHSLLVPLLYAISEIDILRNRQSNTLSMKEMYKMNWLLGILLYAISEIVQCDKNIKML